MPGGLAAAGCFDFLRAVSVTACCSTVRRCRPSQLVQSDACASSCIFASNQLTSFLPFFPHCRADICDVVVHSIELLDSPLALSNTTGLAAAAAEVARTVAAAAAGSTAGTAHSRASAQRATVNQPALPYYQLPAAVQEQVVLVDSEKGLARMEQALFSSSSCGSSGSSSGGGSGSNPAGDAEPLASSGSRNSDSSSSDSSSSEPRGFGPPVSPFRLVVGIDCEWQPYSTRRGDAKTPVSLLQVKLACLQCACAPGTAGIGGRAGIWWLDALHRVSLCWHMVGGVILRHR